MTAGEARVRTRRAVIAGALGGAAAAALAAVARVDPALAANGDPVVLGGLNTAASTTSIAATGADPVGVAISSGGLAEVALKVKAQGSFGGTAIQGEATDYHYPGIGVAGVGGKGIGVKGTADIGVMGSGHTGVLGEGISGWGVSGTSDTGIGVAGASAAADQPGVSGQSAGGNSGVFGYSGGVLGEEFPPSPAKTGVFGLAVQDAGSRGVYGQSSAGIGVAGEATAGRGVQGVATSGYGVRAASTSGVGAYATSSSGTAVWAATSTGYALRTTGRLRLEKASGLATILYGNTSVTVSPGLDVTAGSFVLLTPRADLGTRRLWYSTDVTLSTITIRVSSVATANITVGWLMLG